MRKNIFIRASEVAACIGYNKYEPITKMIKIFTTWIKLFST